MNPTLTREELIAKYRRQLHTFDGQPLRDMADHALDCSPCRLRLQFLDDLAALASSPSEEQEPEYGAPNAPLAERDPEAAFDELYGSMPELARPDPNSAPSASGSPSEEQELTLKQREAIPAAFAVDYPSAPSASGLRAWEPIETAPKNGTRILAFWGREPYNAHSGIFTARWFRGRWCDESLHPFNEPGLTHWMPLPDPPREGRSPAGEKP